MAGNKGPRKRYREKPVYMPMSKDRHDAEAMSLHTLVAGFCDAPTPALFNELTKKLAALSQAISHMRGGRAIVDDKDAAANGIRTAIMTLDAVCQRHDRSGVLLLTDAEEVSLKSAAGLLDGALPKLPVNVLQAAGLIVESIA